MLGFPHKEHKDIFNQIFCVNVHNRGSDSTSWVRPGCGHLALRDRSGGSVHALGRVNQEVSYIKHKGFSVGRVQNIAYI